MLCFSHMGLADLYTGYVRNKAEHGENAWDSAYLGLKLFRMKSHILPDKSISKGYSKLESMMMDHVVSAFSGAGYAWSSIFAPHEIFLSAGMKSLSSEAISCMLSHGYGLEKAFIDITESEGITSTLCSYHKAFVGAAESMLPPPLISVSTSLACDGNLCSFRYLSEKHEIPFHFIDVPYACDKSSIDYLEEQLKTIAFSIPGFSLSRLKEILDIENRTRNEMMRFYELSSMRYYPGKLMDQMYAIMATHSLLGTEGFLSWIRNVNKELERAPEFTGRNILWVHVIPFYSEPLRALFDSSPRYQVAASDMLFDSFSDLDADSPFRSLAIKMIKHAFNGGYQRKIEHIDKIMEIHQTDGAIAFSQWGCKQANGGLPLLKAHYMKKNLPLLILDGDAIDKRNSQEGQIKTRVEAFLELLEQR